MPKGKHANHVSGRAHPRANPLGVSRSREGYVKVKVGLTHPMADANGWCYLHQLVATAAVLRRIGPDELVHHKDEDRANNAWENLAIETRSTHNALHNAGKQRDGGGRFTAPKAAGRVLDGRTWDEYPT